MSIVIEALRDTIELVIDEPTLIIGALCFMIFAAISSLFSWIPLVGPIISIALVAVALVGYTAMVDAAITRKASLGAFIHGIFEYWGRTIKAHLCIVVILVTILSAINLISALLLPIPTASSAFDMILNPTFAPTQFLFIGIFAVAYLPVFLLFTSQTLLCATIVITDSGALTAVRGSTAAIFVTPVAMLAYILLRFGILLIAPTIGLIIFQEAAIGVGLLVGVTYAVSEIYTVCYYRRRKEYLEHAHSSVGSDASSQSSDINST